jgi:tetratricopeptide (TPR) repeat protein/energy-coupling factor transporter ATP-binding protein EcfA2
MFGRGQIIGRDEEQERLGGALRSAREHGELVLLAGDAGIGKSTLASAIAAEARREGRTVLEGRATPSEAPIALSIFRDALRNDRRHRTGDAMPGDPLAAAFVAHLLPELNRDHSDLGERDVLFEGATRLVAELAAPSGLAIVLEDLHWADGTSLDLILHLARTAAHLPLLQVATVRTDAGNAAPGVDRFRFERRRENLGEEIALDALDDAAARELVRLVAPDIPDDASATIRALAAGNPFVLEELGRDAAAGRAPSQGDLPWSVRHMLIDRLTLLEPAERDLIHWAAAAGYCFDLTLLQTAAGVDDDDFLTSLDRLRKAGIIEDDQCSLERMCFRYALTREAVLQELLGADRRRRAAGLLDAARRLAESGATLPLDALVGYAHDAGDHRSAFAYSTEAGHRSRALAGAAEALTHFRRALDTWVPALGDGTRAEALINLGRALMYTDPQSAIPVLGEARALFDSLGDRTNAAVTRASIASVRRTLGERDTALSELRRAAAELPADAPALARLRVADALASALMICGQGDDARTVATEALALVPESPSRDEAINAAHLWVSLGAVPMDDGSDVEALQRGRDLASAMSHPAGICRACLNLDNALRWFRARPEEAARMRAEGRAVAQENGMKSMECWLWGRG